MAGKLGPLRQRRKVGGCAEVMVLPCFQVLKCLSVCPLHGDNCCTVKCYLVLLFCLKEVGLFEGCTTNLFVNSCRVLVGWKFVKEPKESLSPWFIHGCLIMWPSWDSA